MLLHILFSSICDGVECIMSVFLFLMVFASLLMQHADIFNFVAIHSMMIIIVTVNIIVSID